jgi:hypothetical protein
VRLGRDPGEDVTFDLDATESKVYGRRKRGTGRSRHGHLAYNSYVVTWAQRGRGLTSELKGGNQARIKAAESDRMLGRAERLLPDGHGHGQITVRGDSGFCSVQLMNGMRKRRMRFTISATRASLMWSKLAEIAQDAWQDATCMRGAQAAGSYADLRSWFPDDRACLDYLDWLRWPESFRCPLCAAEQGWKLRDGRWSCGGCGRRVSATAGTIFHGTRTPLTVWFAAAWQMTSQKHGISAHGLKRVLGIGSEQTAWAMLHRYRTAMVRRGRDRLGTIVEVDETVIGGPSPDAGDAAPWARRWS